MSTGKERNIIFSGNAGTWTSTSMQAGRTLHGKRAHCNNAAKKAMPGGGAIPGFLEKFITEQAVPCLI
eukprot:1144303-Pelagomonas_calceolata.AAC.2